MFFIFIKYPCTNIFHRLSLYTVYKLNCLKVQISLFTVIEWFYLAYSKYEYAVCPKQYAQYFAMLLFIVFIPKWIHVIKLLVV